MSRLQCIYVSVNSYNAFRKKDPNIVQNYLGDIEYIVPIFIIENIFVPNNPGYAKMYLWLKQLRIVTIQ